VRAEFKKISRAKPAAVEATDEEQLQEGAVETPRPSGHEFWLLKLIFLNEDLAEWCAGYMQSDWIEHPIAQQIFSKRVEAQRTGAWTSLGAFLNECGTPEMRSLVTEAATEGRPIPNPQQQLADVARRLRDQFLDRQLAASIHRANQPDVNDATRGELLRRQQELRQLKRQPLQPLGA
jgi:hypothetical protein